MIMPSYTTLPESMLAPRDLTAAFTSQTYDLSIPTTVETDNQVSLSGLRGMGYNCGDCMSTDDSGNCTLYDTADCSTTSPVVGGGTVDPSGTVAPIVSCDGSGCNNITSPATCASFGNGYDSATGMCTFGASGSSSGSSANQSQQLAIAIAQGGTQVAKIIAAGATGVTVLPNGTIVSPGATNVGALAGAGSSTMIVVIALLAAFMFMNKGVR